MTSKKAKKNVKNQTPDLPQSIYNQHLKIPNEIDQIS